MRCRECSESFRVVTGGMGNSGPPGQYFVVGIAFLAGATLCFGLAVSIWPWALLVFAVIMLAWSRTATSECFNPTCPHCEFENDRNIIRPWSM